MLFSKLIGSLDPAELGSNRAPEVAMLYSPETGGCDVTAAGAAAGAAAPGTNGGVCLLTL